VQAGKGDCEAAEPEEEGGDLRTEAIENRKREQGQTTRLELVVPF